MSYREIYKEDNEKAAERYGLVLTRIREAAKQPETEERFADYFKRTAQFVLLCAEVLEMQQKGELKQRSIDECEQLNKRLYADILPEADGYEISYANPAYAVKMLGEDFGDRKSVV